MTNGVWQAKNLHPDETLGAWLNMVYVKNASSNLQAYSK